MAMGEDDDCDCDSFMQGARNAITHTLIIIYN